jgi:hypothetical protein
MSMAVGEFSLIQDGRKDIAIYTIRHEAVFNTFYLFNARQHSKTRSDGSTEQPAHDLPIYLHRSLIITLLVRRLTGTMYRLHGLHAAHANPACNIA